MQIQAAMLIVLTHQLSELFMAVFCPNKNKSFRFIVAEAESYSYPSTRSPTEPSRPSHLIASS